jgi:Cof subfamily protein (haloacid dehalogenase superfamily)
MRFMENKKLAARIGILTTVITLAGMTLLRLFVSANAASGVKSDITNQMTDAVESRAAIIDEYVLSAEEYMTAFALGEEVRGLLLAPENPELLAGAQKYTEDFAAVKDVFEGLYIAAPETHVLTHTSQGAIGMTTRTGDSLKSFQDTILSRQELTNLGIMKSPGTGSMILSMYYPVFQGRRCVGCVGAGVFASHLMDSLLNLDIKGLPDSEYVFLNVDTGVYLYHEDAELLNTETTDAGYQEIIRRIRQDGSTQANTYSYKDENGVKQLVVYKYLRDRGWVFMVRDNATEVYGAVTLVRLWAGTLCAVIAAAIRKARERGVKFVPATGRGYASVQNVLQALGLEGAAGEYVLSYNGGAITENRGNRLLHFQGLPFETAEELFRRGLQYGVCIHVYTLETVYAFNFREDEQAYLRGRMEVDVLEKPDIAFLRDAPVAKVLYSSQSLEELNRIEGELSPLAAGLEVCYSSGRYLEFNPGGVSKGSGLLRLAELLGAEAAETIAIGDNFNDLTMIRAAGLGVGVANVVEAVRPFCGYVTRATHDQDAVAEVIEKFVL